MFLLAVFPLVKSHFLFNNNRVERETIKEREKLELEEQQNAEKEAKNQEKRKEQTRQMLIEHIQKEREQARMDEEAESSAAVSELPPILSLSFSLHATMLMLLHHIINGQFGNNHNNHNNRRI